MTRKRRPSVATLKLLNCLAVAPEGLHGYALMKGAALASGSLYPILGRLTDRGWLEKTWEVDEEGSGPPRRIYRITPLGRAQFADYALSTSLNAGELNIGTAS